MNEQMLSRSFLCLASCLVCLASLSQPTRFVINPTKTAQTIENFGASGAWYSEVIGKYWPDEKKERMAELLFSTAFDSAGNPLGIGLSAWRFNIGGGTAEQGDSSGIRNAQRRVECFLLPDGTYDWSKQQGYLWFTKKAAAYGVKDLIAFSNTPPVQFTKNGLGFKTEKDYRANLREDRYGAFADFLATVLKRFEAEGLRFRYVSPVNEPQWDWSGKFGQMNQEGSPWRNEEIFRIAASLDSALAAKKLSTKILLPESGNLTSLYEGNGHAAAQMQNFYSRQSRLFVGGLKRLHPVAAGHSYFTDVGDTAIVNVRKRLADTAAKYGVRYWQSEYSMLGNGYKDGASGRIPAMDCALFLAKIIHFDLTVGNATAWQFWNAWEPGRADADTRYFVLALRPGASPAEGDFAVTKNLWAMGHFSRFVRPGMQRIAVERSDDLSAIAAAKDLMLSAYADQKTVVVVAINYTASQREISLDIPGIKKSAKAVRYLTSAMADENMKPSLLSSLQSISLPPRSIATFVLSRNEK